MSEPNIVFVCYETNKLTGTPFVAAVVESFELASKFKLKSGEDKISRSVEAFNTNYLGRDFVNDLPQEVKDQLIILEGL